MTIYRLKHGGLKGQRVTLGEGIHTEFDEEGLSGPVPKEVHDDHVNSCPGYASVIEEDGTDAPFHSAACSLLPENAPRIPAPTKSRGPAKAKK